jgi:predicted transglutaminase-like cysteine proteinase
MRSTKQVLFQTLLLGCFLNAPMGLSAEPRCMSMLLPEASIGAPPDRYREFCSNHESACTLEGAQKLAWTADVRKTFERINITVNQEIEFISDWEALGLDDEWNFPNCQGDCEDFALEKRRRLVKAGFPSAALTMAIAFHEVQFFPHAVLLVETTKGTWVLDNLYDSVLCWDAVPYVFTHRERADSQWTRFRLP